jgi:hypothetical protein
MLVASGVLGFAALVPFSMGVTNLRRDYIVDSERYIRVRFQFSDAAGNDHWGKGPPLPPEEARAHAAGSRVRIRYNPRDPSITRWLG